MAISALSTKGQTTIPKSIRDFLQVGPNDRISFTPMEDGTVRIEPVKSSARSIKGFFKVSRRVDLEEMDAAIRKKRAGRAKQA